MKNSKQDFIKSNRVFAYLALATGVILIVHLLVMKLQLVKPDLSNPNDQGFNWTFGDFLVMGILIFGAGSLFVVLARKVSKKYRLFTVIMVLITFLALWVHLGVGIVDSWPLAGS